MGRVSPLGFLHFECCIQWVVKILFNVFTSFQPLQVLLTTQNVGFNNFFFIIWVQKFHFSSSFTVHYRNLFWLYIVIFGAILGHIGISVKFFDQNSCSFIFAWLAHCQVVLRDYPKYFFRSGKQQKYWILNWFSWTIIILIVS